MTPQRMKSGAKLMRIIQRSNFMLDNLVDMGYTLIEGKEVLKYLPNTKSIIPRILTKLPEDTPKGFIAGGFVRDVYSQMVVDAEGFKVIKDIDYFITDCVESLPKIEWWDDLDIDDQLSPYFDKLEDFGNWILKGDELYPNTSEQVYKVYGRNFANYPVPIDLIFRHEKTPHEVLQDFDYDAVKGIICPETFNMYVSPEMFKFFEDKDTSTIPIRANYFKKKLERSCTGWENKLDGLTKVTGLKCFDDVDDQYWRIAK
jgi:hypothetical protein